MATQPHPLLQRSQDRMIAGVCHGLADYFGVDPVLVRLGFVVLAALGGAGILAYVVLWIIMPPEGVSMMSGPAGVGQGFRTMASEMRDAGRDVRSSMQHDAQGPGDQAAPPPPPPPPSPSSHHRHHRHGGQLFLGVFFLVLGTWLLLGNLGLLDWASARYIWPGVLILLGLALMVNRLR